MTKYKKREVESLKNSVKRKKRDLDSHQFRSLVFSKDIEEIRFNEHLKSIFNGLQYVKNTLIEPNINIIKKKMIKLPQLNSI